MYIKVLILRLSEKMKKGNIKYKTVQLVNHTIDELRREDDFTPRTTFLAHHVVGE